MNVCITYKTYAICYTVYTLGVIKICALVFRELLSLGCINLQNLCGHHHQELMTIPKHPQLVKFG